MKHIRSFNKMHSFFSSKIGNLFESEEGKRIVANYIKLIKENKILRKQYDLYTQLEEGVPKLIKENKENSAEYVNEILISFDNITKKQLKESNNKLFWFLMNNNIITETENPWGTLKKGVLKEGKERQKWDYTKTNPVFKYLDYLLYEGKKDLSLFIENKQNLTKHLHVKQVELNEEKTPEEKIKEFNDKYQGKLTVEEMNLVRELVKINGKHKPVIVEYQKSITNSINDLIKTTDDIELKNKYLQLKEHVLFEDYSSLEKAVKLFEIRQVIDEIKNN